MNELLESYSRLMTILQKMSKSQLEDLGILQEQLSLARQETETLKTQLMIQEKQTRHLVEYNAYLESKQKKANRRFWSGVTMGVGVGMVGTAAILSVANTDSLAVERVSKGLMIGGAATAAVGGGLFIVTIFF